MYRRTLFVAGLHGSGTSLVHRLLRAHPDISGFEHSGAPEDEGQHLQTTLPTAAAMGGPGRFGFHPRAHLTERSPGVGEPQLARLRAAWEPLWDPRSAVRVEKSPPDLLRTRLLQTAFDGACFAIVLRHPLAVAYSTAGRGRPGLPALLDHWLHCHRRAAADLPHLRRVVLLRYEALVADADAELARVLAAVGLSPVPASEPVRDGADARHLRRWRRRLAWPVVGAATRRLARRLEPAVRAFGYSLRSPELRLDAPALAGADGARVAPSSSEPT